MQFFSVVIKAYQRRPWIYLIYLLAFFRVFSYIYATDKFQMTDVEKLNNFTEAVETIGLITIETKFLNVCIGKAENKNVNAKFLSNKK